VRAESHGSGTGMTQRLLLAMAVALGLPASALAQAPAVRCDVVVQSQAGGMIEVLSATQATAPPQITWRPASSSLGAELLVGFQGSSLAALGEPSGVHIRFPIEPRQPPESTTLNIRTQNGRYWRFVGQAVEQGAPDAAYVEFGQDLAYGRAMLSAIADGQTLTISVEHYDRTVGSTTFGTTALRARDVLLAQARRKFETADPAMCKRF
jgi:hypothetical protein